jgi:hypothetical protein
MPKKRKMYDFCKKRMSKPHLLPQWISTRTVIPPTARKNIKHYIEQGRRARLELILQNIVDMDILIAQTSHNFICILIFYMDPRLGNDLFWHCAPDTSYRSLEAPRTLRDAR